MTDATTPHPLMTDLPIGAWTSAMLQEAMDGSAGDRAAQGPIADPQPTSEVREAAGRVELRMAHGGRRAP